MGTPETVFDLSADRKARNAIFASIAVISIAFWSLSSLISPALTGQSIPIFSVIEIVVILGQIGTAVSSMILIFRGKAELGVWRLMYFFVVTAIIRVLVRDSIGLSLGVTTTIVVSAIGYLALPSRSASRAALLAYGVGSAIVLFDLFAAELYGRQTTAAELVIATRNLAIFVFVIQLAVLITQAQSISVASRIANYFALLTLVAVVIVGYFGIQVITNRIAVGSSVTAYALRTLEIAQRGTIITGVLVSFFGAALGVMIARTLTRSLDQLVDSAAKLEAGNLQARAAVYGEDEVSEVATAFNSMASSLQGLVGQLEVRVDERTSDLQRRAIEIQTAVEIGRAATSLRDLKSLMERTTQLITERFGFYHAGIFLVDAAGEYAVLQAANSEGGLRMLEHGHRLKVGETGIVGFVTQTGKARIALDVGQDAIYFDNPHLPNTRSEMALPLIAGGRILGALDVQSVESQAFREEDVATLQILADQLAIAIENARLFGETQKALEAARVAYGDISRDAWAKIIKDRPRISYVSAAPGNVQPNNTTPTADVVRTVESGDVIISSDAHTIGIPIKIRGQVIGALRLKKSDTANAWTHDETTLAIALAEQLSGALESARLYRESQQRAARESLVSDISARITALPRVDTILRETVQELGQAFGNAAVTFQLLELPDESQQIHGPDNGSGASSTLGNDRKDKE